MKLTDKIIKNTFFNTVGSTISTLLNLIILPYIMIKLGPDRFGIWALISVIFGLFTALDFGSGSAFVKYFSEYYAKRDTRAFNQVLVVGLVFMFVFSLLLFVVFSLLVVKLLSFFNIPESLSAEARFVFLGAGLIFAFNNTFSVFQAIIKGLQRMDITNLINIIGSLFFTVGVFAILELGYGLKGIIVVQGLKILIVNLASIYYSKKIFVPLAFKWSYLKLNQLRSILNYGIKMQISNIAGLVNLQTDKTIIGYFLSLGFVAFYEIGQKLSLFCQMIVGLFLSALVPAVSELDSYGKKDSIYKLYEKGNKYLSTVTFPITIFFIIFAHLFINTWMGAGYENSILVVRLLVLAVLVNALTGVGVMIVRGVGKPIHETRYAVISLALNIVLGILLVKRFGFSGVVIATPISVSIGSFYFIHKFHQLYSISLIDFIKKVYLKPFSYSLSLALVLYFFNAFITKTILLESRLEIMTLLFTDGLLFFVPFIFLLSKSHFWDKEDEALLVQKVRPYPIIAKLVSIFV